MLTITLDESDCFAAWVSAKDAGFTSPDGSDPKCECSNMCEQSSEKCRGRMCKSVKDTCLCLYVPVQGLYTSVLSRLCF